MWKNKLLPEIDALIDHDPGMIYDDCERGKFIKLTPLHIAALNGSLEVVVYLLKNGADIDAETSTRKMVRLLMKNGAKFELYCNWHDEDTEMTIAEKVYSLLCCSTWKN